MVRRACAELFAGRGRAAMHGWMTAMAMVKVKSGWHVGRRKWSAASGNGDEVRRRVVVSPTAFVKLVRCLVFR